MCYFAAAGLSFLTFSTGLTTFKGWFSCTASFRSNPKESVDFLRRELGILISYLAESLSVVIIIGEAYKDSRVFVDFFEDFFCS